MNTFGNVIVKEGYTLMGLVNTGGMYHAIIRRDRVNDYVYAWGYDVTDGTWGQGHYCQTLTGAIEELKNHL